MKNYLNLLLTILIVFPGAISAKGNISLIDTTFYDSGKIRSIEERGKKDIKILNFYTEEGESLSEKDFTYSYIDSTSLTVVVEVADHFLQKVYRTDGIDTTYVWADFGKPFEKQVDSFIKYVNRKLLYPAEARENGVEGKVIIRFIVNKEGEICLPVAETNFGYGLEESSIKLVREYKKWGVVKLDGKPVNCQLRLPVNYRTKK